MKKLSTNIFIFLFFGSVMFTSPLFLLPVAYADPDNTETILEADRKASDDAKKQAQDGEYDKANTTARTIVNDTLRNETMQFIADIKATNMAKKLALDGKFDEAINIARTIEDEDLRKKTMQFIGDLQATDFWSVWGAALIVNFDTGNDIPIKSASIINGIVRVEEQAEIKYGLGLEVHMFVKGKSWGATANSPWSGAMAYGPYVAVMPGGNEIIDVIGAGIITGWIGGRTTKGQKESKFSMNIGIGWYIDPDTRILAQDFKDGEPPPDGETTVRYRSVTQDGAQAILSFSYNF